MYRFFFFKNVFMFALACVLLWMNIGCASNDARTTTQGEISLEEYVERGKQEEAVREEIRANVQAQGH